MGLEWWTSKNAH
jgi:hypothetical protein